MFGGDSIEMAMDKLPLGSSRAAFIRSRREAGRVSWVAAVSVAILAAGLGLWALQRRPTASQSARTQEPNESIVEEALDLARPDSTQIKQGWVDEVRGVEVVDLPPSQREIFVRFANAQQCTCGCGFTLAACRTYDLTCPVSLPRVQALFDSVRNGKIRSAAGVRQRPAGSAENREMSIGHTD
jgi:hypothetical protein